MRQFLLVAAALVVAVGFALVWANHRGRALPPEVVADRLLIEKSEHMLTVFSHGRAVKHYSVALGKRAGRKDREGDDRTPEGQYVIDVRNGGSRFHRALHISYPNAADRANATALGVRPGGDVEIHGVPDSLGWIGTFAIVRDWTAGCIAMKNSDVDELWRAVPAGTPIEIRP